jgi:hypothetical protein
MPNEQIEQSLEEVEPIEVDALESEEVEEVAETTEEVAESTEEVEEQEEALEADEPALFDVNVMQSMVEAFGSDIAMATVLNGGDYEDAKEMYNANLIEENKLLKAKLEEKSEGEKPAEFSALEEKDHKTPKRLSDLWNKNR